MPFLSGQRITFVWYIFASLMAQTVKNLPAIQDIWVQSLGQRSLAWRIPQRSLVGYSPWGHKELDMTDGLSGDFSNFEVLGGMRHLSSYTVLQ